MLNELEHIINNTWEQRELLKSEESQKAINNVISLLDKGELRVCDPTDNGWTVNQWVKKGRDSLLSHQGDGGLRSRAIGIP